MKYAIQRKHFCTATILTVLAALSLSVVRAETTTPQEKANMKVVTDYYADLAHVISDRKQTVQKVADRYVAEGFIQHDEQDAHCGQGRAGLVRCLQQKAAKPATDPTAIHPEDKVVLITANGNLVMRIASRDLPTPTSDSLPQVYFYDMYRVRDGKLLEHWSAPANGGMSRVVTGDDGSFQK